MQSGSQYHRFGRIRMLIGQSHTWCHQTALKGHDTLSGAAVDRPLAMDMQSGGCCLDNHVCNAHTHTRTMNR